MFNCSIFGVLTRWIAFGRHDTRDIYGLPAKQASLHKKLYFSSRDVFALVRHMELVEDMFQWRTDVLLGNDICCDCGELSPQWSSIMVKPGVTNSSLFGVLVCDLCAGCHRSLGVQITKVRSLTIDTWTEDAFRALQNLGGNAVANRHLEAYPAIRKLTKICSSARRQRYIVDKYRDRRFSRPASKAERADERQPDRTVKPHRFVDYFAVLTHHLESIKQSRCESLNAFANLRFDMRVSDRFPPHDWTNAPFPDSLSMFCFPDGVSFCLVPLAPRCHAFALTNEQGRRQYGLCFVYYERCDCTDLVQLSMSTLSPTLLSDLMTEGSLKMLWRPRALCLLSHWPFLTVQMRLLRQIYCLAHSRAQLSIEEVASQLPVERYICYALHEIPLPPRGYTAVQYTLGDERVTFRRPAPNDLPLLDCDASLLFHCLDPETILFIVAAVVTEQRIVLTAQRTSWLTPVAETILGVHYFASGFTLIHPFEWQGVYMPLLPIQLIDYVSAPVPFFAGLLSNWLPPPYGTNALSSVQLPDGVVVVNLDQNRVYHVGGELSDIPVFPAKVAQKNIAIIKSCAALYDPSYSKRIYDEFDVNIKPKDFDLHQVQSAFLKIFTSLIRHYRNFFYLPEFFAIDSQPPRVNLAGNLGVGAGKVVRVSASSAFGTSIASTTGKLTALKSVNDITVSPLRALGTFGSSTSEALHSLADSFARKAATISISSNSVLSTLQPTFGTSDSDDSDDQDDMEVDFEPRLNQPPVTFNRDGFLAEAYSASQSFIKSLMDTQLFSVFLEERYSGFATLARFPDLLNEARLGSNQAQTEMGHGEITSNYGAGFDGVAGFSLQSPNVAFAKVSSGLSTAHVFSPLPKSLVSARRLALWPLHLISASLLFFDDSVGVKLNRSALSAFKKQSTDFTDDCRYRHSSIYSVPALPTAHSVAHPCTLAQILIHQLPRAAADTNVSQNMNNAIKIRDSFKYSQFTLSHHLYDLSLQAMSCSSAPLLMTFDERWTARRAYGRTAHGAPTMVRKLSTEINALLSASALHHDHISRITWVDFLRHTVYLQSCFRRQRVLRYMHRLRLEIRALQRCLLSQHRRLTLLLEPDGADWSPAEFQLQRFVFVRRVLISTQARLSSRDYMRRWMAWRMAVDHVQAKLQARILAVSIMKLFNRNRSAACFIAVWYRRRVQMSRDRARLKATTAAIRQLQAISRGRALTSIFESHRTAIRLLQACARSISAVHRFRLVRHALVLAHDSMRKTQLVSSFNSWCEHRYTAACSIQSQWHGRALRRRQRNSCSAEIHSLRGLLLRAWQKAETPWIYRAQFLLCWYFVPVDSTTSSVSSEFSLRPFESDFANSAEFCPFYHTASNINLRVGSLIQTWLLYCNAYRRELARLSGSVPTSSIVRHPAASVSFFGTPLADWLDSQRSWLYALLQRLDLRTRMRCLDAFGIGPDEKRKKQRCLDLVFQPGFEAASVLLLYHCQNQGHMQSVSRWALPINDPLMQRNALLAARTLEFAKSMIHCVRALQR